jgi:hypothetical protein
MKICAAMWNNINFYLGRRGFHDVFGDELIEWPIAKKNKNHIIKTFVLWDAPQLIKLINMNHNMYLSSWKHLGQKWWWTKLGLKFPQNNEVGQNMHLK